VCTTWGITGKDLYLLHVFRRRMEYPELKRAVCAQAEAFNASVVLIEDKASGTQLIQELVEPGLHAVTRYQPQADKVMRMHSQTAMIENGFLHLPKDAAWRAEYLHELTVFPGGEIRRPGRPDCKCSIGSSKPAASRAASTGITRNSPRRRRPLGPSRHL
jgi:predicted phage terminase large subunit-like protein